MKNFLRIGLVLVLMVASKVEAAPLSAELVMSGGRTWRGTLLKRDGEWIEFSTGVSARPIRLGASTIEKINYDVELNLDRLLELKENREFDQLISSLNEVLKPFEPYGDIPSNLTRYRALLMELYFLTEDFDQTLTYAKQIEADAGDDGEAVENAQTYQALALIESGRSDEADALMSRLGWLDDLGEDSDPKQLFLGAKLMSVKKDFNRAMELVAYVIAFNSQNTEWMQPAELFCAEVYTELGMYESAEEVIRQIELLYPNTPEYDKSIILKEKVMEMRALQALEQNS